jgi:hypothetical protein
MNLKFSFLKQLRSALLITFLVGSSTLLLGQEKRSLVSPPSSWSIHSISDYNLKKPIIYGKFSRNIVRDEFYLINELEEMWKDLTFF